MPTIDYMHDFVGSVPDLEFGQIIMLYSLLLCLLAFLMYKRLHIRAHSLLTEIEISAYDMRVVKVYFDELAMSNSIDTLTTMLPLHLLASQSSFSRSPFDGSPLSKLRRQLLPASAAADMTSLDDADMSPTDLSMRKETSSFTSPSSGFDSPSMHYSGHLTDGTQEPHGTNVTSSGSGSLSDAVVADHSRSSTVSPSSSDRQKLSPVPDTDGGSEVNVYLRITRHR